MLARSNHFCPAVRDLNTGLGGRGPKDPAPIAPARESDTAENWSRRVKAAALATEAVAVGIARVDPLWVFEGAEVAEPWIVVLAVKMDHGELARLPPDTGSVVEVMRAYNTGTRAAKAVADWIRARGTLVYASGDDERAVREATNAYIRALNDHDGAAVCAALAPGALDGVKFPESGPDCASTLEHSIGFDGPGGTPVWMRTRVHALTPVAVEGDRARVTATVSHDFSDRPEPSVEEDVIYLRRSGDGWALAKASASLYRAIGYPEPPLRALTPPEG